MSREKNNNLKAIAIGISLIVVVVVIMFFKFNRQEKLIQQAKIYEDVVRACVRSEVCEMINFWGMMDQDSWLEFARGEMNAEACIFDDDETPKLAYYAVLRGLLEGY